MDHWRLMRCVPWLLLTATLLGCGGNDSGLEPVRGTVTFQNAALDRGSIQFFAENGAPSPAGGAMILDGDFNMPREHGLPPGAYRIEISSPETATGSPPGIDGMPSPMASNRERIPAEFNAASKVVINVEADGANRFTFDIP